jgi:hypothetical protein
METNPPKLSFVRRICKSLLTWQGARRTLVGFAVLATLLAAIYAEENWRGKRAWEDFKHELAAKGQQLDWSAYTPAPVPDEQNIFKAPKMAAWFIRESWSASQGRIRTNDLIGRFNSASPLDEFIQKRRSNAVAEITFVTPEERGTAKREGVWLRYSGHVLYVGAEKVMSPEAKAIPLIELQDLPPSVGISNLAQQAGLAFEFDEKVLSRWRTSNESNVSLKWENTSAREALAALLKNYGLVWVEDAKPGVARVYDFKNSRAKVFVPQDTHDKLKQILEQRLAGESPVTNSGIKLTEVRGREFVVMPLLTPEPLWLVVLADKVPSNEEIKEFLPQDLDDRLRAKRTGWRVEQSGNKTFRIFFFLETLTSAADYLAWSDQFTPQFDTIREGLKRPSAQIDADYEEPLSRRIPDFVAVRTLAQLLAERAQCYLLLGQPSQALRELTMMHDLHRLLAGKPTTLVAAMIDVAVTGLYTSIIADGIRLNAWGEPELVALQKQLTEVNLPPHVALAFQAERAATAHTLSTLKPSQISDLFHTQESDRGFFNRVTDPVYLLLKLSPRGWVYQNLVTSARFSQKAFLGAFDPTTQTYSPSKTATEAEVLKWTAGRHPFKVLARVAIPNFLKAMKTTARNQTTADQALIVCGLERYRRAHGNYPESLESLAPQFLEKIPHDIIDNGPLKYRRTDHGKFLLYSIGWDATDDGGKTLRKKDGSIDFESPDWVWPLTMP